MQFTLTANGKEFAFRSLNEEEASKIQDKKRLAVLDKNHNIHDDGDQEMLSTLLSPGKEEAEAFLEENGNFLDQVWQKQLEISGDLVAEEDLTLSDEIRAKYPFPVISVLWKRASGKQETVLFRKIMRTDTKLIKREIGEAGGILLNRMLRERSKLLCLEKDKGDEISKEHAFFYVNVGWFLWSKTFATLDGELKKA